MLIKLAPAPQHWGTLAHLVLTLVLCNGQAHVTIRLKVQREGPQIPMTLVGCILLLGVSLQLGGHICPEVLSTSTQDSINGYLTGEGRIFPSETKSHTQIRKTWQITCAWNRKI